MVTKKSLTQMQETFKIIEQALADSKSAVVLSSFGKDSLLLTWLVRKVNPEIPVLWFRDKRNKFAEKVICDWNLTVLGYAPVDRYLIPDNDGVMLVDEYAAGQARIPVLHDVVLGEDCDIERLPIKRTPRFNYPWDVTFFGYKHIDSSTHAVTNYAELTPEFSLGHTRMIAPLHEWNDEQVMTAISELGISYEPQDDSLTMCAQCFDRLSDWDRAASLSAFQSRYGFH